jgi:hypothetical protein
MPDVVSAVAESDVVSAVADAVGVATVDSDVVDATTASVAGDDSLEQEAATIAMTTVVETSRHLMDRPP